MEKVNKWRSEHSQVKITQEPSSTWPSAHNESPIAQLVWASSQYMDGHGLDSCWRTQIVLFYGYFVGYRKIPNNKHSPPPSSKKKPSHF